jgi:hypothetical protein
MAKKKTTKKENTPETSGVVILAFGKRGYYFAAYNLAKSIKVKSPNIHITLFHDNQLTTIHDLSGFDNVEKLDEKYYNELGRLNPGKAKLYLSEFTPYYHTLFVDADCIALQDISQLLDNCIKGKDYFLASMIDKGGKEDKIEYSEWATNETIWKHFKLKDNAILPALQSTLMYFRKSEQGQKFFDKIITNSSFPVESLKEKWGGTLPDELIYSATSAQFGLLPEINNGVFFGHTISPLTFTQIEEQYYFLTIYGNGIGITKTKLRYIEWYDRLMRIITNGDHKYKSVYINQDKHANQRK